MTAKGAMATGLLTTSFSTSFSPFRGFDAPIILFNICVRACAKIMHFFYSMSKKTITDMTVRKGEDLRFSV